MKELAQLMKKENSHRTFMNNRKKSLRELRKLSTTFCAVGSEIGLAVSGELRSRHLREARGLE